MARFRPGVGVRYEHMFVDESPAGRRDPPPGDLSECELGDLPLERLEHEICQLAAQLTARMARWLAQILQ